MSSFCVRLLAFSVLVAASASFADDLGDCAGGVADKIEMACTAIINDAARPADDRLKAYVSRSRALASRSKLDAATADAEATPAYTAAALTLHLGAAVVAADGAVSESEKGLLLAQLEQWLRDAAGDASEQAALGQHYQREKEWDKAIEFFQRAKELAAEGMAGLLVGIGIQLVLGVGGIRQGVEQRPIVPVD